MRMVLTGATGFVGAEVLRQLLAHPEIERVTCLTRRPLTVQHPKLTELLHTDFTVIPQDLARTLAQHEAAIWTLGGKASDIPGSAEYEQATVTTTLAFAQAVAQPLRRPFRFCYLSGMGADPTETARLPWQRQTRHLKGRAERGLEHIAQGSGWFRAASFRAGGILPSSTGGLMEKLLAPISIRVDRLASVLIREALSPDAPPFQVFSNREIRLLSR